VAAVVVASAEFFCDDIVELLEVLIVVELA